MVKNDDDLCQPWINQPLGSSWFNWEKVSNDHSLGIPLLKDGWMTCWIYASLAVAIVHRPDPIEFPKIKVAFKPWMV